MENALAFLRPSNQECTILERLARDKHFSLLEAQKAGVLQNTKLKS
jgi:hypothetical protein